MKKYSAALIVCAVLAGFASAQESKLKQGTVGLIEDGAIDSLDYGIEDADGIVFTAYKDPYIELGWGQYFLDDNSLWISVYDSCYYTSEEKGTEETVSHVYGSADGINIDYIDTTKRKVVIEGESLQSNLLAVGIGLDRKIGFQPYWKTVVSNINIPGYIIAGREYDPTYTADTIEAETTDTSSSFAMDLKFTDVTNRTAINDFGVRFQGVSTPKLFDDHELYFQLNSVSMSFVSTDYSVKFSEQVKINDTSVSSISAKGNLSSLGLFPSIGAEMGLILGELAAVTTRVELEDSFAMGFELPESNTSYTLVNEAADTRTVEVTDYEKSYGDFFMWRNSLTPKVFFDFDVDERLTLKACAKAAFDITHVRNDDDVETVTNTVTEYDKTTGTTTSTKTTTRKGAADQNLHTDIFALTPEFDLGFVYQAVPDRLNLNFGITILTGSYTWKKTELTNANVNKVTTVAETDALGNTSTSTVVQVETGDEESSKTTFSNGESSATLYVGATWFFTKDIKLDVYFANDSGSFLTSDNEFGIDFSIRY